MTSSFEKGGEPILVKDPVSAWRSTRSGLQGSAGTRAVPTTAARIRVSWPPGYGHAADLSPILIVAKASAHHFDSGPPHSL
jgi:hypothetical protein